MIRPVKPRAVNFLAALILYVLIVDGVLAIVGADSASSYMRNVTVLAAAFALSIGGVQILGGGSD